MRIVTNTWAGVTATVYFLDAGEKIARHLHPVAHTIQTLVGETMVEIFDPAGSSEISLGKESPTLELPADISHEFIATADGTIVLNMIAGTYAMKVEATAGGVALHDGTVVPHGA